MNKQGFREFLEGRQLAEDKIEQAIPIVERFESFLNEPDRPTTLEQARAEDVRVFAELLIQERLNTFDNFVTLARYGQFVKKQRTLCCRDRVARWQ